MSVEELSRTSRPLVIFGLLVLIAVSMGLSKKYQPTFCHRSPVLNTATGIEVAVNCFHIDYGVLPSGSARLKTEGLEGIQFLRTLLGRERSSDPLNTRGIQYLYVKEGTKDRRNGLVFTGPRKSVGGLYDPWGNPYIVLLDTDGDDKLSFRWGKQQITRNGVHVAVFTPGRDHKEGTEDDVRTW